MAARHELFPSVFICPERPGSDTNADRCRLIRIHLDYNTLRVRYARARSIGIVEKTTKKNKIIVIIIINTTIVSVCTRTSVHERAHIRYKYSTCTLNSKRWYRANVFNRQCGYSLYEWSRQRDVSHIQTSLASTVKP